LATILFITLFYIIRFWNFPKEMAKALVGFNTIIIVGYTPLILAQVVQLKTLLKRSDTYIFSNAVLSDFQTSWRHFYFRVTITDQNGRQITGNTNSLYKAGSSIIGFEDWYNQRVLVAYDPEKEKMIVVGLSKSFPDNIAQTL